MISGFFLNFRHPRTPRTPRSPRSSWTSSPQLSPKRPSTKTMYNPKHQKHQDNIKNPYTISSPHAYFFMLILSFISPESCFSLQRQVALWINTKERVSNLFWLRSSPLHKALDSSGWPPPSRHPLWGWDSPRSSQQHQVLQSLHLPLQIPKIHVLRVNGLSLKQHQVLWFATTWYWGCLHKALQAACNNRMSTRPHRNKLNTLTT